MFTSIANWFSGIFGKAEEELHDILSGYHTLHDKLTSYVSSATAEYHDVIDEIHDLEKKAEDIWGNITHAKNVQQLAAAVITPPAATPPPTAAATNPDASGDKAAG